MYITEETDMNDVRLDLINHYDVNIYSYPPYIYSAITECDRSEDMILDYVLSEFSNYSFGHVLGAFFVYFSNSHEDLSCVEIGHVAYWWREFKKCYHDTFESFEDMAESSLLRGLMECSGFKVYSEKCEDGVEVYHVIACPAEGDQPLPVELLYFESPDDLFTI